MNRRLGRKAIKTDSRTLRLACYLTAALPAAPPAKDWSGPVKAWGMLLNDTLGDCTIAGIGHAVQTFTANSGSQAQITDAEALEYYEDWDGYEVGDSATDNGGVELDVLTQWQKSDFAGHKLAAYTSVNPANTDEVRQAINLFGGLYIGMMVPNFIMANVPTVWDVNPNEGGIDGGHCVFVVGYDELSMKFVSWGETYKMTWAFWAKYVDEAHALLSPDFLDAQGLDPEGFNLAQLQADLAAIR